MKIITLAILLLTSCEQPIAMDAMHLAQEALRQVGALEDDLVSAGDQIKDLEDQVEALEARLSECSCAN